MTTTIRRRVFIKESAIIGAGAWLAPKFTFANTDEDKKIRIGFIGIGLRGTYLLEMLLKREDVEIPAICDIDPARDALCMEMIAKTGRQRPKVFDKGEEDYLNLLNEKNIDAVVIATPWEWHTPMAVAAMKAGKYVGLEVAGALKLEECWQLIDTYEQTRTPLMFLENVCYRRDVMAVLNMARQGLFGELTHCHCGYQHDLRHVKFNDGKQPYGGGVEFGGKGLSEARWRTLHSVKRNGELYPTHGIGPVSAMLNINRGNRFLTLVSMATKPKGLHKYIVDNGGAQHPNSSVEFKLGDIVTTLIKCENGETVVMSHDTNSPRPYSLNFRVQGTNGLWMDDNDSIYLEKISPEPHKWESFTAYQEKYDHPLWKKHAKDAENAGHGGIDYFVTRAFAECVKRQIAPPIDVYDAAAWMAITPLSEKSIAEGSTPQVFPDFTRGKYKTNPAIFGGGDDF